MRFMDFLGGLFSKNTEVTTSMRTSNEDGVISAHLLAFANEIAQNYITGLVGKCEFKTYINNKTKKGDEYYLWNYEPNPNQSAYEFKTDIVKHLLNTGECLVVELNNSLYVAYNWNVSNEALYPVTYKDVSIIAPDGSTVSIDKQFKAPDVLHFKLDNGTIRNLLINICNEYEELFAIAKTNYKKQSGTRGIININKTASGTQDQKKRERELIEETFKKYFSDSNGLAILPNGYTYDEKTTKTGSTYSNEITNIKTITAEAIARVAQAYKIPSSILSGEVVDTSKAIDQMLTFCIDPILKVISEEITRKRYGKSALSGSYLAIDGTTLKHIDIFSIAAAIDKLLADGVYCIDEIREKVGDTALYEDWSAQHWITKNYQGIDTIEKGGGA
jgi:HK97 family phage portal protein